MFCSLYRSRRSRALLEPKIGDITIDDIKKVLADRFGAPRGICRSPVRGSLGNHYMTVASIVMDTGAQEMYVCGSPHNNNQYVQYSVESGAGRVPVANASQAV